MSSEPVATRWCPQHGIPNEFSKGKWEEVVHTFPRKAETLGNQAQLKYGGKSHYSTFRVYTWGVLMQSFRHSLNKLKLGVQSMQAEGRNLLKSRRGRFGLTWALRGRHSGSPSVPLWSQLGGPPRWCQYRTARQLRQEQ